MTPTVKEVMAMLDKWGDLDGRRKVVVASKSKSPEHYNDSRVASVKFNAKRIVLTLV